MASGRRPPLAIPFMFSLCSLSLVIVMPRSSCGPLSTATPVAAGKGRFSGLPTSRAIIGRSTHSVPLGHALVARFVVLVVDTTSSLRGRRR